MSDTKKRDEKLIARRIKGEQQRCLENITARTERSKTAWWLSFADDDGFRGAVIVHADGFTEAVMECNLRGINPHGECQGLEVPGDNSDKIPERWKYRILSREECAEFDKEMAEVLE